MSAPKPRPIRWFESGFIVVPAMRTLARILELAAAESADWVVLRRAVDWQPKPLLYVYRLGELEALRRKAPALAHVAAEDALELHEAKASAESRFEWRASTTPLTLQCQGFGIRLASAIENTWYSKRAMRSVLQKLPRLPGTDTKPAAARFCDAGRSSVRIQ